MKQNRIYINHIIDEVKYLLEESQFLAFDKFSDNETLKRAFSRSIEIIGEAIKNISENLKLKYPNIEWKKIAGMRDKIIHHYFGVNYYVIWDVVKNKLPDLKLKLEEILKEI